MIVGWASRPSLRDGRDAHPTIIKIVSYLMRDPKSVSPIEMQRFNNWIFRVSINF
jgi:hypothetical protein